MPNPPPLIIAFFVSLCYSCGMEKDLSAINRQLYNIVNANMPLPFSEEGYVSLTGISPDSKDICTLFELDLRPYIEAVYGAYLNRLPEPAVLEKWLAKNDAPNIVKYEFICAFKHSFIYMARRKRLITGLSRLNFPEKTTKLRFKVFRLYTHKYFLIGILSAIARVVYSTSFIRKIWLRLSAGRRRIISDRLDSL